ncbi:hypothetical protein ACJMK2_004558 [Sinanodonta woodiana]|uniref:RBR-type E3 ubiquitin transferase n=1 Tax=Sinanodonta woodiana TaxID=1069815 RepID=A0ABD3Y3H1_SINWO
MKKDSEVTSMASSTSKSSERKKNARFSIRRIFYASRSRRTKSHMSLDSDSSVRSDICLGMMPDHHENVSARSVLDIPHPVPEPSKLRDPIMECPLCLTEWPKENFPEITTCYHRSCMNCLQMYLRIEITESRINIACPECSEKFHPNDIKAILQNDVLMQKYEDFMVRRVLVADPDARWCPAPDCWYAVIASGCAGCPKLKCERPGCNTNFCYHCKQFWHPNKTCDAARAERSTNIRSGSLSYSHETDSQRDDIKPCPRCSAFIMKMNDGSCNHMTCPVCGAEFCWLCMKEISDLHYLSPSGCTFWGKKPWSRKKKILWQLGTLVGAPVGITLMAGIAVPAMIIGIPVWVGRKLHSRYETASKHKRNLAITGGVVASILVSPIVAGLAVGIGVPILLGYVYGVVPISLCRSGGCGVTTNKSGGVRFEFDEENENGNPSSAYAVDNQSVGTGHHVANPSIAPSIGEASVGMTNSLYSASGSHMDRIGIIRDESDRDSASNRAMAGASLNGSLCGSTYAAVVSYQTKLEVHADVSATTSSKRASFSSESANFSIGEKSIGEKSNIVPVGDDASTKALAGSLSGCRIDSASITTSEVQMDLISNHSSNLQYAPETDTVPEMIPVIEDKNNRGSCPGSPVSACSSLGDGLEGRVHTTRCRKCKRSSMSSGEKCAETMSVHFSENISLQSFVADDFVSELQHGKHSTDFIIENTGTAVEDYDMSKLEKLAEHVDSLGDESDHFSSSLKCTLSSATSYCEENYLAVTEVENDIPVCTFSKELSCSEKRPIHKSNSDVQSLSRSSTVKGNSIEQFNKPRSKRVRHHSCELAMETNPVAILPVEHMK